MSATRYFEQAVEVLNRVAESERDAIEKAAEMLVDAVVDDQAIYSFGATHSFILTEELVYRTGGLMLVNPIYPHGMNLMVRPMTQTSKLERVLGLGKELLDGSPAARRSLQQSPIAGDAGTGTVTVPEEQSM